MSKNLLLLNQKAYLNPRFILRSYAGLAYNARNNESNKNATIKVSETMFDEHGKSVSKEKDFEEKVEATNDKKQGRLSSLISFITPGINSPLTWTKQHPIPDPIFEVISPGTLGALLLVKIPPRSEIFAAPGTAIAVSSKVLAERTTDGNVMIALGRKLAGGSLIYHKFTTGSHPGDVLLGPTSLSDAAVISMDGTSKYYVRKGALLARGPRVTVSIRRVRKMGALNAFANCITGRGTLVITSYGAIHRLVLNHGDSYLVNARHLIAWNSQTNPTTASSLISPSAIDKNRLIKRIKENLSSINSTFFDTFRNSPSVKPTLERLKRMTVRTRKWAFGGPEFLQLTGPGDFYLSTRVEPVLGGFKSLTSPSIEEIVAAQPEPLNISSTPQSPPFIPSMCYATVSNDGTVTFTKSFRGSAGTNS
ncbi:18581_t:CDS:2 [Acaulospora morrowiae]|uniref:Altered inheritance of mitochondria protein 24, mitochondrial n=1 Tax=Acaulospora morrowiae TaxID=94023 RepID=A0A9N8VBS8_9GLOM|nr:18581_t:CDS:2 [Acaulospora morrowiae]